jgi:DNA-binding NtrC family response regulator
MAEAMRVLIVDDDSGVLELVTRTLGAQGYEVSSAPNAEEALQIVRFRGPVDLVLADVLMPGMHGPALLDAVRKVSPSAAAVLMSGYPGPYATTGGLPLNTSFLQKPFLIEDLVAVVERALAGGGQARAVILSKPKT